MILGRRATRDSKEPDWRTLPAATPAGLRRLLCNTTRHLSPTTAVAYAFSADGQTIYGIRRAAADRLELFSVSVAGGTEKTIGSFGREHLPVTLGGPATRLSLAPDGRSLTFSTSRSKSNLWMIEGLSGVTRP